MINYTFLGHRYDKVPDQNDLDVLDKIENMHIECWYPRNRMCEGREARRNDAAGILNVNQFFTKRNLAIISYVYSAAEKLEKDEKLALLSAIRGAMSYGTKMVKVNV